jgi:hypothetical protein
MCGDCDKVYEKDPVFIEIFNRLSNAESGDERVVAYKDMEKYIWDFQLKNPLCEVAQQTLSDESDDDWPPHKKDPRWIAIQNRSARARTDHDFFNVRLEMEDYLYDLKNKNPRNTHPHRNFNKYVDDAECSDDGWVTDDDSEEEYIESLRANKVIQCAYAPTNSSFNRMRPKRLIDANSEMLEKEEVSKERTQAGELIVSGVKGIRDSDCIHTSQCTRK